MFKKFMKPHHGRGSSSSGSKDKCHKKWKGHHYYKKTWGLAALYGGEPEQYSEFAEKYEDLRPMKVFEKWAEEHDIPKEEFKRRFTEFRCQKLSGFFGKAPETYKEFVEANIDLPQRELMEKLFETGLEKRENKRKCGWGGRRFNFNEAQVSEEKTENKKERSGKKEKSQKKKEKSFSKDKNNRKRHSPSME